MSDHSWLGKEQLARIDPYFPLSRAVPRGDDHRDLSGIIEVLKRGLQWRDAPTQWPAQDPLQPLCALLQNGYFRQYSQYFNITACARSLADKRPHLKAHRTGQPFKRGDVSRDIGRPKGGLNSKRHAVCDGYGRPVLLHLTAGQVPDDKGRECCW